MDLLGRVVNLTEVTTKMNVFMAGELVTTTYVDEDFRALKTVTPVMDLNMEMLACSKDFALADNEAIEMFDKAFLPSNTPVVFVIKRFINYYSLPIQIRWNIYDISRTCCIYHILDRVGDVHYRSIGTS